MGIWSDIPVELLGDVAKRLRLSDMAVYGALSRTCQSISTDSHYRVPELPWLMLSDEDEHEENGGRRNFFSLSADRHVNLLLPEAQGKRCWGSSHGWLITLGFDMDISLLNPLTRAQIDQFPQLPRFESFGGDNIKKIILSSKPSSTADKDCKLLVLYSQCKILAVCSPGEKSWTTLESTIGQLSDAIYFEGMLYVISDLGKIGVWNIPSPDQNIFELFLDPPLDNCGVLERGYLVEICGELHMVRRQLDHYEDDLFANNNEDKKIIDHHATKTSWFEVFKLNICTGEWVRLLSLGDHALFLGRNSSFSLLVSVYPDLMGDCIYFTDDHVSGYNIAGHDNGIFSMGERRIINSYWGDNMYSMFSPPLWIVPNPSKAS